MSMQSSATQLFEGQTTHPLSPEEKAILKQRFKLTDPSLKNQEQLDRLINDLNRTPTGAQGLRNFIASGETVNIDFSGKYVGNNAHATYDIAQDTISFQPYTEGTPHRAINLLHEATHDVQATQNQGRKIISKVALDAETQALNQQLSLEMGVPSHSQHEIEENIQQEINKGATPEEARDLIENKIIGEADKEYNKVYKACYKMWRGYADNPETTPKGFLKFEPKEGVNVEEAKEAYAQQMASYHARQLYSRDFISYAHPDPNNPKPYFKTPLAQATPQSYAKTDKTIDAHPKLSIQVPTKTVEGVKTRNPFVSQNDYNPIRNAHGQPEVHAQKIDDSTHQETLTASSLVQAPVAPVHVAEAETSVQAPQTAIAQAEAPVQAPVAPVHVAEAEASVQAPQTAIAQAEAPVQAPLSPLTAEDTSLEAGAPSAPRLSANSMAATLSLHAQPVQQESDITLAMQQQMDSSRTT